MDRSALLSWWRLLRTIVISAGVLLSFLAVVEIVRVYIILRELNPWVGFGFVGLIVVGSLWIAVRFLAAFWSLPRAPLPPRLFDAANPSVGELRACGRFLQHRIQQISNNPSLSIAERNLLDSALARLSGGSLATPTFEMISDTQTTVAKVMAPLDLLAERLVQDCVRDVMLGVVLSPYRSADLLMVIYRNGRMILQLAKLYQTRPAPIEQIRIFTDILGIVATVNFLNFTEKFLEQLVAGAPVFGAIAGDVTQGIGAGLLTSATGHAAIERCKCIGTWNREGAQEHLRHRMSRFARDVKTIFQADVLPKLRPRLPDAMIVADKFSAAFDGVAESINDWIWRPASKTSSAFATTSLRGGTAVWHGMRSRARSIRQRARLF